MFEGAPDNAKTDWNRFQGGSQTEGSFAGRAKQPLGCVLYPLLENWNGWIIGEVRKLSEPSDLGCYETGRG